DGGGHANGRTAFETSPYAIEVNPAVVHLRSVGATVTSSAISVVGAGNSDVELCAIAEASVSFAIDFHIELGFGAESAGTFVVTGGNAGVLVFTNEAHLEIGRTAESYFRSLTSECSACEQGSSTNEHRRTEKNFFHSIIPFRVKIY